MKDKLLLVYSWFKPIIYAATAIVFTILNLWFLSQINAELEFSKSILGNIILIMWGLVVFYWAMRIAVRGTESEG